MASDAGLNTDEVQEALKNATSEEEKRYLERVLESRGVRKAVVSSHEIVAGNPDAYPERTVEQQEQEAIGRPHEPVQPDQTSIRGNEPADTEGTQSTAQGNQAGDKGDSGETGKSSSKK